MKGYQVDSHEFDAYLKEVLPTSTLGTIGSIQKMEVSAQNGDETKPTRFLSGKLHREKTFRYGMFFTLYDHYRKPACRQAGAVLASVTTSRLLFTFCTALV